MSVEMTLQAPFSRQKASDYDNSDARAPKIKMLFLHQKSRLRTHSRKMKSDLDSHKARLVAKGYASERVPFNYGTLESKGYKLELNSIFRPDHCRIALIPKSTSGGRHQCQNGFTKDELHLMMSDHNSSDLAPQRQMMYAENNTSGPVPQCLVPQCQMTSDHNSSELAIQDNNNEQLSSKLVPKVVP
ncbi:hypothetical protein Tco_0339259 [Tanacetum coccineum]